MNSRISAMVAAATLAIVGGTTQAARADGVTAYLPLNLEPEVERQIERVLILAEEPILKRPIAVNLVQLALPAACLRDRDLCNRVKKYLERYSRDYGVTHASVTGAIVNGAHGTVPNEHGLPLQSPWDASAQAFVQPNDYFLASAGVVTNSGRTTPTGTVISMGFNWAQLDIGYRDHWFSPMTDSSMMIGTEAATMPSATISNYEPLGRLGFQYEFFVAQMSSSDHIAFLGQNVPGQQGRGHPKLAGGQFTIEPLSGWSLGVNQLLQYGGAGLKDSPNTLLHYFFKPSGLAQTLSNHQASYVSRFVFPARIPFAVYAQYAGEDNSNGGSYLLGNTATSIGIDFPLLGRNFDATYEVSEWQNFWYTNSIFLDGMINYGNVIGSWGGDQRVFNDGVGARSQMLRVGWTPPFGGYLEERVRTLVNQNYGIYPYQHYLDVTVRYSRPWKDLTVGGEVLAGRDVFGKSFSRVSGFVRYGGSADARSYDSGDEESAEGTGDTALTELFVDAGGNANKVKVDLQKGLPITTSPLNYGPHVALGARRAIAENDDLGVRVEFDEVQKHSLIGFRPLDYRHRFGEHLALGLYAGVARYALGTPAYSIYGGVGAQWRDVLPKWDVGVDFRYAQNVARDHVLATDPPGVRADSFYKIESVIAGISRRF